MAKLQSQRKVEYNALNAFLFGLLQSEDPDIQHFEINIGPAFNYGENAYYGLFQPEDEFNGARFYSKTRYGQDECDLFDMWIEDVRDLCLNRSYYFQSIEGINDLLKRDKENGARLGAEGAVIKIKTIEGLGHVIHRLKERYKELVWSEDRLAYKIPINLLEFGLVITIQNMTPYQDIVDFNDTGDEMCNKKPAIVLLCNRCMFDFIDNQEEWLGGVNNADGGEVKESSLTIRVFDVIVSDNPSTLDTFGTRSGGYPSGAVKVDVATKEASERDSFGKRFLNNNTNAVEVKAKVAEVKSIIENPAEFGNNKLDALKKYGENRLILGNVFLSPGNIISALTYSHKMSKEDTIVTFENTGHRRSESSRSTSDNNATSKIESVSFNDSTDESSDTTNKTAIEYESLLKPSRRRKLSKEDRLYDLEQAATDDSIESVLQIPAKDVKSLEDIDIDVNVTGDVSGIDFDDTMTNNSMSDIELIVGQDKGNPIDVNLVEPSINNDISKVELDKAKSEGDVSDVKLYEPKTSTDISQVNLDDTAQDATLNGVVLDTENDIIGVEEIEIDNTIINNEIGDVNIVEPANDTEIGTIKLDIPDNDLRIDDVDLDVRDDKFTIEEVELNNAKSDIQLSNIKLDTNETDVSISDVSLISNESQPEISKIELDATVVSKDVEKSITLTEAIPNDNLNAVEIDNAEMNLQISDINLNTSNKTLEINKIDIFNENINNEKLKNVTLDSAESNANISTLEFEMNNKTIEKAADIKFNELTSESTKMESIVMGTHYDDDGNITTIDIKSTIANPTQLADTKIDNNLMQYTLGAIDLIKPGTVKQEIVPLTDNTPHVTKFNIAKKNNNERK